MTASATDPLVESLKYLDGLMFVLGTTEAEKVELRVLRHRDLRQIKQPPLSWALYQGPPPENELLEVNLDDLLDIDGRDELNEAELVDFALEVHDRAVKAADQLATEADPGSTKTMPSR